MYKRSFVKILILVAIEVLIDKSVVLAQWSTDPAVNNAITTAGGVQHSITSDGAGGANIVWAGSEAIFAQRISASGVILWTTNGVRISPATESASNPQIVGDGAVGAIIVWTESVALGTDIYAQRISAGGVIQWTTTGVAISTASNGQSQTRMVSDGAGGAIIAWQDFRGGATSDMYAQRVNGSGVVQWTTDGVAISTASNNQTRTAIVSDGAGGAIIAWQDFRSGATSDIYAQRINASGVVQWTADGVAVSTATNNQTLPVIVSDGAGGAIIAWLDFRSGATSDIYAQRINGSGVVQWTTNGVPISTANLDQVDLSMTSDASGGAILAWADKRSGLASDIYAQRVNAAGTVQWVVDGVAISLAINDQLITVATGDGAGGAIIAWEDRRTDAGGSQIDIYAQRIGATGAVQWTTDGVAISTANSRQERPRIISSAAGGVIIAWTDARNSVQIPHIYAQSVTGAGALGFQVQTDFLFNPGFEEGLTSWTASGCANAVLVPGCSSPNSAKINITGQNCNAKFFQDGFAIVKNNRYRVRFNAWSSNGADMQLTILPRNGSTPNIGLERRVDLRTTPCASYTFDFTATESSSDARLRFLFNYLSTTGYAYWFDNVSIERLLPKDGEVEIASTPTSFSLQQNYPNPFNPTTEIKFSVEKTERAKLEVFNLLGEKVATVFDDVAEVGQFYRVRFDGANLASGVYLYRLQSGKRSELKKFLLLK